ncbi:hypothetical protein AB0I93_27015 [Streptomyces sp. NPDC049967]|uniref:hypothetical protein n=1 Tax=Streptomyces sp. NPDC049967 TaxID=3155658 RepID=UPI0034485D97
MSAASIDPQRIEQVSRALKAAMAAGNREPYNLAFALEAARLLQSPETAAEQAQLNNDVTGACLARWEEEQDNARLRLALKSAKRGRSDARAEFYGEQAQHRTTVEQRNEHVRELVRLRAQVAELATQQAAVLALHRKHVDSDHCFADDEQWPCQTRSLLDPTGLAAVVEAMGALPMPTGTPVPSPWERAVAGLNALVDAGVAFHVEPDGHISAPASDEHIEWDLKARRWVLTHDDEDDDSHEAQVREYLSTPYTDDTTRTEAEALAAVDRSIAAQFPLLAALRDEPKTGGAA